MDMNWFESLIFGLLSGLTDILPVSAQAHKAILLTMLGAGEESPLLRLLIHGATLGALYYCCQHQIMRIVRQRRLAKVPKRRRKRPVDLRVLLDYRLLTTMVVPVVLGFLFYPKASALNSRLNWIALFLVINGVILYLPNILPSGNKDARSLSRLEGVLMGLGGAVSVLPGISSVGAMSSVGSVCGTDRTYVLNISLLAQMAVTALHIVFDFVAIVTTGIGTFSFGIFICYLLAAAAAFAGVFLGIKLMRTMAVNIGFGVFAYYSLGLALLSFILYLSAV